LIEKTHLLQFLAPLPHLLLNAPHLGGDLVRVGGHEPVVGEDAGVEFAVPVEELVGPTTRAGNGLAALHGDRPAGIGWTLHKQNVIDFCGFDEWREAAHVVTDHISGLHVLFEEENWKQVLL
jgi:hypothetical protein